MSSDFVAIRYLLLLFAGWVNRQQRDVIDYLFGENQVLREQLRGRRIRLNDKQRRRLALKGKRIGRKLLREYACIVTPDTILRWYRNLVAKKYDGSTRRGPGRPPKSEKLEQLVVRLANENTRWGYTRIRDEVRSLGFEIGRTTVQRILVDHGIEPAPNRGKRTPWAAFLKAHWEGLAAADFFTLEVLTLRGIIRYSVFFVIELSTRRVHIASVHPHPTGAWMVQLARNVTDTEDGFLLGKSHIILDRDPLYTSEFRQVLRDSGVEAVRLPARSPNLNAYAERFVLSAKTECFDRVVRLGERHMRCAIRSYLEHYHRERHHQALESRIILPGQNGGRHGLIVRRERLGGMLNHYFHEAA